MAELISQMYWDAAAFGQASASLKGRDTAVYPIRIKMLTDTREIGSGQLTWGVLADLNRIWGNSTTLIYTAPQPGWAYHWNTGTGIFAVTDNTGAVTMHTGVYTLSGLGISWVIIESGQFGITDTNYSNSSAFLIAARVIEGKSSHTETVDQWDTEYLADGVQHAVFNRLSRIEPAVADVSNGYGDEPSVLDIIVAYFGDDTLPDILLSRAGGLSATNDYLLNLTAGDLGRHSERQALEVPGQAHDGISYLMIALFAQRLLSTDSKLLYEPWMLHQVFHWYFSSPGYASNARQIFDLSPNWG